MSAISTTSSRCSTISSEHAPFRGIAKLQLNQPYFQTQLQKEGSSCEVLYQWNPGTPDCLKENYLFPSTVPLSFFLEPNAQGLPSLRTVLRLKFRPIDHSSQVHHIELRCDYGGQFSIASVTEAMKALNDPVPRRKPMTSEHSVLSREFHCLFLRKYLQIHSPLYEGSFRYL